MNRIKRTSAKQYEMLVDFVERHPELIYGRTSESFTTKQKRALWEEVTCSLNSVPRGPQKSFSKWRKTWCDFKHLVRVKATQSLKYPDTFGELTELEQRVVQLCKWNFGKDFENVFSDVFVMEERENYSSNEGCEMIEVPSTSLSDPQEVIVPNILYVSNADKEEGKEKKQNVTLEDIQERLETQNNLITEGISFVREIAKSQKKIADAELLKARALSDLASTISNFLESLKK